MKNRNLEYIKYFAFSAVVYMVVMVYKLSKFPQQVNAVMWSVFFIIFGCLANFLWKYMCYRMRLNTAKQTVAPIVPTDVQVCLRSYYSKARRGEIFFKCTFVDENGNVCFCQSELYSIQGYSGCVLRLDSGGVVFAHLPTILIYPAPNAKNSVVEVQTD